MERKNLHEGHDHSRHDDHAEHSHGVSPDADKRYVAIAMFLLLGFLVVEVVIGFIANSLALITDAGHMLTDVSALALALVAMRLSMRPAGGIFTFGLRRGEILSAQINGVTLLVLAAWFAYEAVQRLVHPPEVEGLLVLIVGLVGIVINVLAVWVLARANRQSLNVEGGFQHVLTDLYAFMATVAAGFMIYFFGLTIFDPIAALFVAALMFRAGWMLVRESGRVFLQAAPRGLNPEEIGPKMASRPGVEEVHDLHVWEITSGVPALSAHVVVGREADCHAVQADVERMLADDYHLEDHVVLQVDHAGVHDHRHEVRHGTRFSAREAAGGVS
jgi:cobalt-zinc-cadmium efflux system protein